MFIPVAVLRSAIYLQYGVNLDSFSIWPRIYHAGETASFT